MATTTPTAAAPLPCNRSEALEELLLHLEQASSEILSNLNPSAQDCVQHEDVLERIKARGKLIEQLAHQIGGVTVTYVEWNRMVVIHRQGMQIEASLRQSKQGLIAQTSTSGRNRAFLDCVSGVFRQSNSSQNILA